MVERVGMYSDEPLKSCICRPPLALQDEWLSKLSLDSLCRSSALLERELLLREPHVRMPLKSLNSRQGCDSGWSFGEQDKLDEHGAAAAGAAAVAGER